MSTIAAAAGAFINLYSKVGNVFLISLAAMGFLLTLFATPDESGKNAKYRIGLLLGFSFCTGKIFLYQIVCYLPTDIILSLIVGFGLGPLLDTVIRINPSIIPTAFLSTSLIFTCFSICSLLSPRGQYLMLGAPLLSLFSILSLLFMANIFIGSTMVFQVRVQCYCILNDLWWPVLWSSIIKLHHLSFYRTSEWQLSCRILGNVFISSKNTICRKL